MLDDVQNEVVGGDVGCNESDRLTIRSLSARRFSKGCSSLNLLRMMIDFLWLFGCVFWGL